MENKNDFTTGSITRKLLKFAIPIFWALVLQSMYGAVDMLIVGHFGTTSGISAVSTGNNIVNLVVFTVAGLSMGVTVLISRYLGEKKGRKYWTGAGRSHFLFLYPVSDSDDCYDCIFKTARSADAGTTGGT